MNREKIMWRKIVFNGFVLTRMIQSNFTFQIFRHIGANGRIGGERWVRYILSAIHFSNGLHQKVTCMLTTNIVVTISVIEEYHMMPVVARNVMWNGKQEERKKTQCYYIEWNVEMTNDRFSCWSFRIFLWRYCQWRLLFWC